MFREQGFVAVPGVFQPDECRSLAELVERVVDEQAALLRSENLALLGANAPLIHAAAGAHTAC